MPRALCEFEENKNKEGKGGCHQPFLSQNTGNEYLGCRQHPTGKESNDEPKDGTLPRLVV